MSKNVKLKSLLEGYAWERNSRDFGKPLPTLEDIQKAYEAKQNIKEDAENAINEDMALVGDIALGVVGGLAAVWAIVKGIPVVVGALGMGASSLVDEIQDEARKALAQARRQGRLETIKPIIAKFENDTKLKNMYKDLPPYSTSTSAKGKESNVLRTKQLQEIAEYIKSKLTKDEMQYFTDISSMLRTGDIK